MKTYVAVGVGMRFSMFLDALGGEFKDTSALLAICDSNKGRLNVAKERLAGTYPDLRVYLADGFDDMLATEKPSCVIVCTTDCDHDDYICKALRAGCNVVTEKPMTINESKCQAILDAVQETGNEVRVAFNYRYAPFRSQVKELLMAGVIGRVLSVDFHWMLDTNHGADYFRRWHRNKRNSGGLLVHKSTHHFDLVNWWLSDIPETVFAKGDRQFYTSEQAKRYNLEEHAERCLNCGLKDRCNFYHSLEHEQTRELYLDCEKYDGYLRDKCVFSDDIDIEDMMSAIVKYRNGTLLTYSLNAFSSWEGYTVVLNGTKGRLEHVCREASYTSGDGSIQGAMEEEHTSITIHPHFKEAVKIPIRTGEGGHGGGDSVFLNDLFGDREADPLKRAADHIQGAYSILVGIAANKSIETGREILIDSLVDGLGEPAYPDVDPGDALIPYVKDSVWVASS